ncbi:MAG: response regulator [Chloroflexi bacterium]|nr:response regulator [Chloroflexota bacterium]
MSREATGRILVVDDISYWRRLIPQVLRGYEVRVAATYEEALEAIECFEFDVAILDVRLRDEDPSNVDGIYVLRRVRERRQDASVVILTGHRKSLRDEALVGCEPYELVSKPFENAAFRQMIERLVARSKRPKPEN